MKWIVDFWWDHDEHFAPRDDDTHPPHNVLKCGFIMQTIRDNIMHMRIMQIYTNKHKIIYI